MGKIKRITALVAALFLACLWANAAETTRKTYDYRGFDELEIGWVFDVEIIKSNKFSVEVEATDEVFEYLRIEQRGDVLHMGTDDLPRTLTNTRNWNPIAKAIVYMPELKGISMSGASKVSTKDKFTSNGTFLLRSSGASKISGLDIEARRLEMHCSGAVNMDLSGSFQTADLQMSGAVKGRVAIGADELVIRCSGAHIGEYEIDCGMLSLGSSGATKLKFSGIADNMDIDCTGACDINLLRCETQAANVELSGAARCQIAAKEKLTVELTGASACRYIDYEDLDVDIISISRGSSIGKIKD